MAAPTGNENSKTQAAQHISIPVTVVMPQSLIVRIDAARSKKKVECNRSAFIRELIENGL